MFFLIWGKSPQDEDNASIAKSLQTFEKKAPPTVGDAHPVRRLVRFTPLGRLSNIDLAISDPGTSRKSLSVSVGSIMIFIENMVVSS